MVKKATVPVIGVYHLLLFKYLTNAFQTENTETPQNISASLDLIYSVCREAFVFLGAQLVENPPAMWETWVRSLGLEDPLEKPKANHSSILAWRIPWTV